MQSLVHPTNVRAFVRSNSARWITFATVLAALILGGLGRPEAASSAVRYEPVLEWLGPRYAPLHSDPTWLPTDDPIVEIEFQQPRSMAAREHSDRDVIYVLDAGNRRIQAFEVNATFHPLSQDDFTFTAGVPAAGEYNDQFLRTAEFAATTTQWIVPGSEAVQVAGNAWRRVDDLTGFTAADQVYRIDYASPTNQPQFEFPTNSFVSASVFAVRYLVSDLQDTGGGAPTFGIGEIDYGTRNGNMTPTKIQIDEFSGGPADFNDLRAITLLPDVTTATTDHIFVVDSGDQSSLQNEQVFSYHVDLAGTVTAGESYDDYLLGPYDISAVSLGTGQGASAWIDANTGPFDKTSYPFVTDASQVTGHSYQVDVAAGLVTITDLSSGNVIVDAGLEADFADPFLAIPGLSLPQNAGPWADGTTTVITSRAEPDRFLFVTDTDNDRIKVIGMPSGVTAAGSNWSGDWLPSDPREVVAQPAGAGAIGAIAGQDYSRPTPAAVSEDWVAWTQVAPIAENTLNRISFLPSGTAAQVWSRVGDLSTASPADSVFQVDWKTGQIRFGDGIHGAIPPSNIEFTYTYSSTPDVVRYGNSGTGDGRFSSPRGVAARWNSSLARVDVYVSDTANQRVQKLAFQPADTLLGTSPRMNHVVTWQDTPSDQPIRYPAGLQVGETAAGNVYLAVCDPANQRVVVLEDTEASEPIPGPPALAANLGRSGNELGNFVDPVGATFLTNGLELDLYVADETRDVITKYEESPSPTITLLYTGDSALPNCFPPQSNYHIRFSTTHTPFNGWVDFYYDTKIEFDESTAKLALPLESVSAVTGEAFWVFADTPGGPPPDGDFYLFARLKDAPGSTIASDQTTGTFKICIDSSLSPTIMARDAIDHDPTLYLQNGLRRNVDLQVVFPESLLAVSFVGTYDPSLVEILEVTPGTAWDGTGSSDQLFSANVDSVAGTYAVYSSVAGAPNGLSGNGPFTIAHLQVRARDNALTENDRFRDGILAVDRNLSSMTDLHGVEPADWRTQSLNIRLGYLGDIATTGAGADSIVPFQQPRPDGRIDFDDQLAFTLGWNGLESVRDPIADMGPSNGASPDLMPVPDASWNVDDLLVLTSQNSFFNSAGWNAIGGGGALPGQRLETAGATLSVLPSNPGVAAAEGVSVTTHLLSDDEVVVSIELAGMESLSGARIRLEPPSGWTVDGFETSADFSVDAQLLQIDRRGANWFESGVTRLAVNDQGIVVDGGLGQMKLSRQEGDPDLVGPGSITIELRNIRGEIAGVHTEGVKAADSGDPGRPLSLFLATPTPNPTRAWGTIQYAVPGQTRVRLGVFGVDGRQVRSLVDGTVDGGTHTATWNGENDHGHKVGSGVYYYVLTTPASVLRRAVVYLR